MLAVVTLVFGILLGLAVSHNTTPHDYRTVANQNW
jgi:small basic protein